MVNAFASTHAIYNTFGVFKWNFDGGKDDKQIGQGDTYVHLKK